MPKKFRLSRADFVRLEKSKHERVHGDFFSLSIAPLPQSDGPKMASVVSKKVSARAVDRNRIERQCRETLQSHMRAMSEPLALVFRAKAAAAHAANVELGRDVERLLKRARLIS